MSFLKGPIGFLVGNKVSPAWIRPGGGIGQGDTLSPALFALLTALLCRKLQQKMPQARPFLYADDTLVWIEGSPTEVQASVRKLKGIMQEYGDHTGQRLNISKCAVILQGDWGPLPITSLEGIPVEPYVRYLGRHLGKMAPYDQYAAALRKFEQRHDSSAHCPSQTKRRWQHSPPGPTQSSTWWGNWYTP